MIGLPEPPQKGQTMLPSGAYVGKVVMVTGGGTGLGKAMATEFARLGATVAIASRSAEHRANGVRAVEEAGGRAVDVALDVRDAAQVAAAFDQITQAPRVRWTC